MVMFTLGLGMGFVLLLLNEHLNKNRLKNKADDQEIIFVKGKPIAVMHESDYIALRESIHNEVYKDLNVSMDSREDEDEEEK